MGRGLQAGKGLEGDTPGEQSFLLPGVAGCSLSCSPLQLCSTTIPNPSLGAGSGIPLASRCAVLWLREVLHLFPGSARESSLWISLPTALGSAPLTCCCDLPLILYKSHTSGGESTKALGNKWCKNHTPLYWFESIYHQKHERKRNSRRQVQILQGWSTVWKKG